MNSDIDTCSVSNKKVELEHHTDNKDESLKKENVNTFLFDKTKDELTGQAKEKSEEVSKVFFSLEENEEDAHFKSSWRDESISDDEESENEDDWSDEDEEAAEEWLRRQELRDRGLPEVLATLPSTIKVSLVPETKENKQKREEKQRAELVRRREEYRKKMSLQSQTSSLEKGKRKFGERMTLEEAGRADFDNGQDYVDFLNSKLQNVSIKMTR